MQECYLLSEKRMVTHKCVQETNIALLQLTMQNIETKMDKIDATLSEFIKEAKQTFATREEVSYQWDEIEKLKTQSININLLIAKVTGWAIVGSAVISYILNKFM